MFLYEELQGEPTGTIHNTSSSTVSSGSIKIRQLFENNANLKMKLHVYAMKKNFEFKMKKSGSDVWFITCVEENCSWTLQARKLDNSEMFEVRVFVSEHTCTLALRQKDNRYATPWVIGACIRRKYMSYNHNYLPKSIIQDIFMHLLCPCKQ